MRTHINGTLFRIKRVKGQYGLGMFCDIYEKKGGFQLGSVVVIVGGKG